MNFIGRYFNNGKYQQDQAEYEALKQQSYGPTAFLRGEDHDSRKKTAEQVASAKAPEKQEIKRSLVENMARERNAKAALGTAVMMVKEMPPEARFTPAEPNSLRAVAGIEHFQVSVVGAFGNDRTGEEFTLYQSNFKGDTKLSENGNLVIDPKRVEKPSEERQDARVFFAKRKHRGRDGQMITDPKLAFRHENEAELI